MLIPDPDLPTPLATNAYLGAAGPGVELMHHDGAEAAAAVTSLVAAIAAVTPPGDLPGTAAETGPGWLFGDTGTALFLALAGAGGRHVPAEVAVTSAMIRRWASPAPGHLPEHAGDDFVHGLAGIGTGALALHEVTGDDGYLAVARRCADRLLAGRVRVVAESLPELAPELGVPAAHGLAHGSAGVTHFLLEYGVHTGDEALVGAARQRLDELAARIPALVAAAGTPVTRPMAASWCQGLAGIGSTLVSAGRLLRDQRLLDPARSAGRACLALAPRLAVVSQCCGLAGVGELMIDLAADGDEEFLDGAHSVLDSMVLRSGSGPDGPVFPGHSLTSADGAWGTGTTGILAFVRRLVAGGGPRPWSAGWRPARLRPGTVQVPAAVVVP